MAALRASGPELLDAKLTRVRVDRSIDAPAARVWEIISDPTRRTEWYPACDELVVQTPEDSGVGAVFFEREWLWKATTEVVEWDEGSRIGLSTRSLNLPGLLRKLYTEFRLDELAPQRTKVTIAGGFAFGPLGWILVPYTYPQMVATMWFDYRGALKALADISSR